MTPEEAFEKVRRALVTFDEAMRNVSMGPNAEKHKRVALRAAHRKAVKALVVLPALEPAGHPLTPADRQQAVEAMSRAIAASIYHSEGLETMSYTGVNDYCDREWHHYTEQSDAALSALEAKDFLNGRGE